jgi:hypothetical protein
MNGFGLIVVLIVHISLFITLKVKMGSLMSTLNEVANLEGIEAWNECVYYGDEIAPLFMQTIS